MTGTLMNIGDLAKPATTLIEKVSDAIGGIAKPWQITRTAKAEAEAKIILAKANVEIGEIEQRAVERLIREETAKQKNIEEITTKALPDLTATSKPQDLEKDWLNYFFDRCRNTSDEEMQSLWARILAGQSNHPGSFSKRSIEMVSVLEKEDAQLFTKLCSTCWLVNGQVTSLVIDLDAPIYKALGIDFALLTNFDALGLLRFDTFSGFKRRGFQKYAHVFYFGKATTIELPENISEISLGKILLTNSGRELAAICGAEAFEGFEFYIQELWMTKGFVLSCPISNKRA